MVAVTAYPTHAITKDISYTFFPGIRPLQLKATRPTLKTLPLILSSSNSHRRSVAEPAQRQVELARPSSATTGAAGAQVLAASIEGQWSEVPGPALRAVVVGDADFASNSFYPYAANSDLILAMVRWLLREDTRPAIASRIPVPPVLMLTKPQRQAVFMGVEVVLPALVALLGAVVWWRRR